MVVDSVEKPADTRRFYDGEPVVSHAIDTVMAFPKEFQSPVAKGLSMIAIKDFDANAKLKSLGKDVVLPLYKSKQKRRFYDSNPDLHNAMNYMRILSPEERIIASTKLLEIAQFVEHYLNICDSTTTRPSTEKVQAIRDTYVIQGGSEVKMFVESVCMDLLRSLPPPKPVAQRATILNKVEVVFNDDNIVRYDTPH